MPTEEPPLSADFMQQGAQRVMQRVKIFWLCVLLAIIGVLFGGGCLAYCLFGLTGVLGVFIFVAVVAAAVLWYLKYRF